MKSDEKQATARRREGRKGRDKIVVVTIDAKGNRNVIPAQRLHFSSLAAASCVSHASIGKSQSAIRVLL